MVHNTTNKSTWYYNQWCHILDLPYYAILVSEIPNPSFHLAVWGRPFIAALQKGKFNQNLFFSEHEDHDLSGRGTRGRQASRLRRMQSFVIRVSRDSGGGDEKDGRRMKSLLLQTGDPPHYIVVVLVFFFFSSPLLFTFPFVPSCKSCSF